MISNTGTDTRCFHGSTKFNPPALPQKLLQASLQKHSGSCTHTDRHTHTHTHTHTCTHLSKHTRTDSILQLTHVQADSDVRKPANEKKCKYSCYFFTAPITIKRQSAGLKKKIISQTSIKQSQSALKHASGERNLERERERERERG